MKRSLTGLEWASGIPGSIGGGLYMNAGAYKDNLANHLIDVCVLKDNKEPSRPTINGCIKAQNAVIEKYSMDDIGLTLDEVGIKGSPTFVSKAFRPQKNREKCQLISNYNLLAEKIKEFGGI